MRVETLGAMGDEVAMTAAIREAKRQRPDEMIRIAGRLNRDVWLNCPYINIGNEDDGKLVRAWSFYRNHVGSRTRLYFKLLSLDLERIEDELPELWWTAEELASPIMVKKSHRKMEKEFVLLEEALAVVRAPIVAVDPGAGWATRKWPEEKYSELTGKLAARGFAVVLVGSRPRGELPGIAVDLVNRLSLRALARFLGRCALFVGNDSGLFHLSAAVGTPHVTIYGPTRKTCGPYPGTIAVEPEAVCPAKCFEFCGRTIEGDEAGTIRHCMEEIAVDRVLEAVELALARPRPPSRLVPAPTKAEVYAQLKTA
jgi:ADP-heptose:LPS heptosyltransferase